MVFFEKINNTDKSLTRLIKKNREKTKINKIRNEREVTTNATETQRTLRKNCKQFCHQTG